MPLRSRPDSPRPLDLSTRESLLCRLQGLELACVRSTTTLPLEPELTQQPIERGAFWYSFRSLGRIDALLYCPVSLVPRSERARLEVGAAGVEFVERISMRQTRS